MYTTLSLHAFGFFYLIYLRLVTFDTLCVWSELRLSIGPWARTPDVF